MVVFVAGVSERYECGVTDDDLWRFVGDFIETGSIESLADRLMHAENGIEAALLVLRVLDRLPDKHRANFFLALAE